MPSGKMISFEKGEYPEIDGLENGAPVEMNVQGHIEIDESGNGNIVFDNVELSPSENHADRAMSSMMKSGGEIGKNLKQGAGEDF